MSAVASVPSSGEAKANAPLAPPLPPLTRNNFITQRAATSDAALGAQGPVDHFEAPHAPKSTLALGAEGQTVPAAKLGLKTRLSSWARKTWIDGCTKLFGRR